MQVIIGANKEAIISEKHCTARLNQTAAVGYSGAGSTGRREGGRCSEGLWLPQPKDPATLTLPRFSMPPLPPARRPHHDRRLPRL